MSFSSVIEKCISLVTGKGSDSDQTDESTQQDQNVEQNQQYQNVEQDQQDQQEDAQVAQNPEFYQDADV